MGIHSFPAELTGEPKSKIITCFPFSVKFTNISSPKSYPSHNCTFNSFALFLIFSQSLHLHPIHFLYSVLVSLELLLLSSVLPFSELLLPLSDFLLSLSFLLSLPFLDINLISLEKLLGLSDSLL